MKRKHKTNKKTKTQQFKLLSLNFRPWKNSLFRYDFTSRGRLFVELQLSCSKTTNDHVSALMPVNWGGSMAVLICSLQLLAESWMCWTARPAINNSTLSESWHYITEAGITSQSKLKTVVVNKKYSQGANLLYLKTNDYQCRIKGWTETRHCVFLVKHHMFICILNY